MTPEARWRRRNRAVDDRRWRVVAPMASTATASERGRLEMDTRKGGTQVRPLADYASSTGRTWRPR